MKILVSGSSGFIGSALVEYLKHQGHTVIRLVRYQSAVGNNLVFWNPNEGTIESERLTNIDAVVHLAGENIASGRWNEQRKARIRDSRVNSTRLISETVAHLQPMPEVLVSASASGYYGSRGGEILTEESSPGSDFLAEVSVAWEAATRPASDAGIRVVNMRSGLALHPKGGPLQKMLPAFRLGAGGKLGDGKHYMSWLTLTDAVRAIHHILNTETLVGPTIIATPNPVTNAAFTKSLGRAISRPTIFSVPRFMLRMMFGEIADTLLASTRMQPAKLMESGFEFDQPELDGALTAMFRRG